jgi:transaldolase
MKPTKRLYESGQSIWLDNITRSLLTSGTLGQYIREFSVSGLTSNPTIFDHAIRNSRDYDDSIRTKLKEGRSGERVVFDLELEDLRHAADLFRPIHDATSGVDGWASLEVSPALADDAPGTIAAAKALFAEAARPNIFIKIPGTKAGVSAIEESIYSGVPINVTLLFSKEQYLASAEAYLRGIERRLADGLRSDVPSVASLFVSRWDVAVADKVPEALHDQLGIAIARQTYKAYRELLDSPRWQKIFNAGARPQRLLWASTGTKDPKASDVLYIESLIAPLTINTMPENTLKAFADHGRIGPNMSEYDGDPETVLDKFAKAGIDIEALADQLQKDGAASFVRAWNELIGSVMSKGRSLQTAGSS